ncbi:MAG TPA: hypothetical protein VE998_03595 [Terriglobales bacterium]|nr:hypothetical protein [Terriglobales bacterium]
MTDFESRVLSDLAELKSQMCSLLGIGQPGRLSELEASVTRHDRWMSRASGIGAALGVLLLLLHIAVDYLRR